MPEEPKKEEEKIEKIELEPKPELEVEKKLEEGKLELGESLRLEDYQRFLEILRKTRQSGDTVPTYVPKSFLEQFYLYESGTTRRLYVYINGTWHNASVEGMTNPMTAVDDIIYGGVGGVPTALGTGGATKRELTLSATGHVGWQSRVLNFINLLDVPPTYAGSGGKSVRVNAGATALEFFTPTTGTFTEIAPPTPTGVTTPGAWEDWDLSASIPAGATYAEIQIMCNRDSSNYTNVGVRKNGSALNRLITFATTSNSMLLTMTVELDANRICERCCSDGNSKFTVDGYWS